MLDMKLIRTNPDEVIRRLVKREPSAAPRVAELLDQDRAYRAALTSLEELLAERNSASKAIGLLKREGKEEEAAAAQRRVGEIKEQIERREGDKRGLEEWIDRWLFVTPNLPDETTPAGGEENNQVLRTLGEPPTFDFSPKAHWDIATGLDIIDFARGTKLSGSGFVLYKGNGALLERALIQFMIDLHVLKHGYTEWLTPFFLSRESVTASAHIVKFTPEMYHDEEDDLFALPTAEPALVNIHRDEILNASDLPLNYVAYSPCWRREAGAAGKDTRGLAARPSVR